MEVSVTDYYDDQGVKRGSPTEAAIWNTTYQRERAAAEALRDQTIRGYYKPRSDTPRHIPVGAGAAPPEKKSSLGKAIFWGILVWIVLCLLPGTGTQKAPSHPARPAAAAMQAR
jgi:hypothetical protein